MGRNVYCIRPNEIHVYELAKDANPRMRCEALLDRDRRTVFVDLRNSNPEQAPGILYYQ